LTLWFDTSDVWGWQRPHLTGVQRVVSMVLGELLKTGSAIRLFRFDPSSQALVTTLPEELPAIIYSNGEMTPALPGPGNPEPTDAARGHPPANERFLDLAYRRGPEGVRVAIDNLRFAQQDLKYALLNWFNPQGGQRSRDIGAGRVVRSDPAAKLLDRPPFQADDVCLALGLTSVFPGYWNAVTADKSQDVPFVQLLHDIELVMQPQWTPPHWEGFAAWLHQAVAHASLLLTVSRFQQSEIRRYLRSRGLPEKPVEVVELGDDPRSFGRDSDQPLSRRVADQLSRPFVLFVSGFFLRKNHYGLYHAWRRLSESLGDQCPQLVLVGERPPMRLDVISQMQRDPLTKNRISIIFDVSDEELAQLYRACLFTVYPSYYEGWGLPVSESLKLGRYCIASSAASLPEVGGDLVDYVDPFDQMALYQKLLRAIQDPDYVRSREAAIRQHYRPRDWAETSRQILACVARARSARMTAA
jgi:glycosyltransferase involved in cell wall biosynthesis